MLDRINPYSNFNFRVDLPPAAEPLGGFTELSGLDIDSRISTHREGTPPPRRPAPHPPRQLSLKRGQVDPTMLEAWHRAGAARDLTITLQNASRYAWRFKGVRIIKYVSPFGSLADGVVEELVLSFEQVEAGLPAPQTP
jgi:hypothetical protein